MAWRRRLAMNLGGGVDLPFGPRENDARLSQFAVAWMVPTAVILVAG